MLNNLDANVIRHRLYKLSDKKSFLRKDAFHKDCFLCTEDSKRKVGLGCDEVPKLGPVKKVQKSMYLGKHMLKPYYKHEFETLKD